VLCQEEGERLDGDCGKYDRDGGGDGGKRTPVEHPKGDPGSTGQGGQSAEREELGAKQYEKVNEVFSGEDYTIVDGKVRVRFGPYETKAFLFRGGN